VECGLGYVSCLASQIVEYTSEIGRSQFSRKTLLYGRVYRVLAQVGIVLREIWKTMHLPHFTKTSGQVLTASRCAEILTVKYEIPCRWRRRAPKRVGEYNVT